MNRSLVLSLLLVGSMVVGGCRTTGKGTGQPTFDDATVAMLRAELSAPKTEQFQLADGTVLERTVRGVVGQVSAVNRDNTVDVVDLSDASITTGSSVVLFSIVGGERADIGSGRVAVVGADAVRVSLDTASLKQRPRVGDIVVHFVLE